ncbi:hypothetical protein GLOIN_2v1886361 [Rhizophagus irregularis DAOM 181602=DAOM 197198]|nr:hypothetical protein GLOIN_2v1886361 [Rhizophagus irregularis DAOM 181602=DAOM 197198]
MNISEHKLLNIDVGELNAKLLTEIAELMKENDEIPELKEKLLRFAEVEAENTKLKQIIEENARRDSENAELKSRVGELEARLALLEQSSAVDGMALSFGWIQNGEEAMPVVMVPTVDVPDSVIDKLNNEVERAPSDLDGNDEKMDNFLDEAYKKSISNEIRERRLEKKQRDQEALVISQDVTKIPEVTDMLTSEQDKQNLSQSYEASSENIRSASCILSKQPQVNASKLACNLENREDSSRLKSCDMEELKPDQHDEVIAKKAIKVGQEAILYWCYFIEKYDKMIDNFVVDGVKKKTATSMVYQEIKQLLLDITDVNLRQKILRARKLYKLFNTLGIEKIKQVSYSADAISSLRHCKAPLLHHLHDMNPGC